MKEMEENVKQLEIRRMQNLRTENAMGKLPSGQSCEPQ